MRLGIAYRIAKVPIDYRAPFVSLIKEAIEKADPEVFNVVYRDVERLTKPFCFSVFFQDFKINDGVIEIGGFTNLNVSMLDFFTGTETDGRVGLALFNGLRNHELAVFKFPNGEKLTRVGVPQLLNEKPPEFFRSGIAQFKTMSPIFLTSGEKNGAKAVLHPATKDGRRDGRQRDNVIMDEEIFKASLAMSLKGHIAGAVDLQPENLKVEVIQHTIGDHMRSRGKPLKFVCSSGTFILRSSPENLHRIYQTGLGFKRNQGFGMLEVR